MAIAKRIIKLYVTWHCCKSVQIVQLTSNHRWLSPFLPCPSVSTSDIVWHVCQLNIITYARPDIPVDFVNGPHTMLASFSEHLLWNQVVCKIVTYHLQYLTDTTALESEAFCLSLQIIKRCPLLFILGSEGLFAPKHHYDPSVCSIFAPGLLVHDLEVHFVKSRFYGGASVWHSVFTVDMHVDSNLRLQIKYTFF